MKKKIGVVSLGCPKNLVDSEIMLGLLQKDNYEITSDQNDADIIIVNTCGFIESAKQESINSILEMAEYKKKKCKLLIVTGCLAERYKSMILEEMPEVDAVIGTGDYGRITSVIESAYNGERIIHYGHLDEIGYLENTRLISTGKGYAYLKIAEGCDNCCTYCIIPSLRGRYRSRRIEDILKEAEALVKSGIKEVILVAQDTTRYGIDIYKERKIVDLIRELSGIAGLEWIRLLYCYPEEIDERLINEIAVNNKVCKYLDIPIQHISDRILKAMGRRGSSEEIKALMRKLRERIPGIIIRTTFIVGFPGEDEKDFDLLYEFVKEYRFDKLGVFTYSKEEDTPAAKMKNQIKSKDKQERHNRIMSLQRDIAIESSAARIGKVYRTLVEGISDDGIFYYGRTYAEAPEIDAEVYFTSPEPLEHGDMINIKVLNTQEYDLIGEVTNEFTE
ncbi:MAG TPA: 30S ribosomal protein S12 methylthiotransferase RimO [Clostridia bacterium]|nr:30S ribosomal protein S12 methylthiotransferase RimO [Clostridia bacterium]